ncbi:hypothetical protein SOVF_097220 [Spinacia oleracea]|uniref:UBP1-associated protein 2C-like n=1 Tax=Spinacia oleracea TaxID=3562 RepID=A0A9R0K8E3_SPIOL|nr:UBP1-associated protein 2C-like [Spinacia oleracea]XP_021862406.2 UBP1-associated protein 2C-like [Spinacia oleracea]XP_056689362.1 UBP1-associated protein 2C-like [Spinacia oleracea]KNA15563.1 hypothetical protein SOVF_097220 [Spinacia oleracea]
MDASKKRKADENGNSFLSDGTLTSPSDLSPPAQAQTLTPDDARKLIEPFTIDQLRTLLQDAVVRHPEVLVSTRALADSDVSRRKLFVRGLGPTTTDSLKSLFTSYGELDEAVVISDKTTGKSKGYGFVTFKHVDGALLALRQPSKKIDGRMTVTHLASAGRGPNSEDQATRKIYVGNVPYEISAERLLDYFAAFGEVEEGPLGFDKQGGKARGFAFFVYKTEEGARMSLMEPMKMIDGHQVMCKLAEDGKKGKMGGPNPVMPGEMGGDRMSGSMNPQTGSYGNYGPGYNSGPGMGMGAAQGGGGGPYGLHSQYPGSGEYASYRMPPPQSSMGMPPPYQEGSGYGPPSSGGGGGGYGPPSSGGGGGYMGQNQPPSQGPPQGPPGGMYQRMPPSYY